MSETTKNLNKLIYDDNFIMLPTVDFVFKLLFGDIKHKERLISLLSAVLNLPESSFKGIEIINNELPRLFEEDKKGILDIRAKLSDEKQVDIEIQVLPHGYMPERTLYYWSKMYITQAKEGDTFDILKKCITINIVDYNFLPVKKMHTRFHLTEDETGYKLTDVLEVHFCELKKLQKGYENIDIDDPSIEWMRFIGSKSKGEMEMLAQNNEAIKDVYDYLKVISKDEENRLAYEARQAWLMDQRTREKLAREEGMKEGMKEGKKEGKKEEKKEIAKNLKSLGIAYADISIATGLTQSEVEQL